MSSKNFKIKLLYIICLILVVLTGCAKVTAVDRINVQATVVDTYYRPIFSQPIVVGKIISIINHPAVYEVTIEYEDVKTTINDQYFYEEMEDNIDGKVDCQLIITHYNNGDISKHLNLK